MGDRRRAGNRRPITVPGTGRSGGQAAGGHDIARHVGLRLQEQRLARGVALDILARAVHLTPDQLAWYEAGAGLLPAGLLVRVAEFLDVAITGFFAGGPGGGPVGVGRHPYLAPGMAERRCGTRAGDVALPPGRDALAGLRVLVVEDDPHSAAFLGEALTWAGGRVIGPALDVSRALSLLDAERPEVALLDVDMGAHVTSAGVAAALASRGAPYLLVTGREDLVLADVLLRAAPRLSKPIRPLDLITAVAGLPR